MLVAWSLFGLALSALGHFRNRAPIPLPAFEIEQENEHKHARVAPS